FLCAANVILYTFCRSSIACEEEIITHRYEIVFSIAIVTFVSSVVSKFFRETIYSSYRILMSSMMGLVLLMYLTNAAFQVQQAFEALTTENNLTILGLEQFRINHLKLLGLSTLGVCEIFIFPLNMYSALKILPRKNIHIFEIVKNTLYDLTRVVAIFILPYILRDFREWWFIVMIFLQIVCLLFGPYIYRNDEFNQLHDI
ncbi:hypothetical protein Ciccas_002827, partial [Cichlidogyrus casuarinus]